MNILIHPDYETPKHAGADGYFQVCSVEDENGKDWTGYLYQGHFFTSGHEVAMALSSAAKKRIEHFSFI